MDGSNFEYRNEALYSTNGRHFSQKGYKKLASDLAELMIHELVKLEFAQFKVHLGL